METKPKQNLLSLTGQQWIWPKGSASMEPLGIPLPELLQPMLVKRGILTLNQINQYLSPALAHLEDPAEMADMDKAVQRVVKARVQKESIAVFGDYDVDGVSSTSMLVDFLKKLGLETRFYIPDRRHEGYGLNTRAIRELAETAQLLIAVDCGISAMEPIRLAQQLGMDVIVIDHHQVPKQLPPAVANLNPHRSDCNYRFKSLCAAGLVFMFMGALRRQLRESECFKHEIEPDLKEYLDLVALATVADMVPLVGSNRVLVASGLKQMARTSRPGLKALLEVAKVDPHNISSQDLGFRLGPRINAMGRLNHAYRAVELMLEKDEQIVRSLAQQMDQANFKRRDLEAKTTQAAMDKVHQMSYEKQAALVLNDPTWHPGVLGLVATKLTRHFNRPVIVIGEKGKGSGRSIPSLDLYDSLCQVASFMEKFGGHAQAAGLTVATTRVDSFRHVFVREIEKRLGAPPYSRILELDTVVDLNHVNTSMWEALRLLEPFGQENPEPLLVSRDVVVRDKRIVGKTHLKMQLGDMEHEAIAFGMGHYCERIPVNIDIAFHLTLNCYQGRKKLQLNVADIRGVDSD